MRDILDAINNNTLRCHTSVKFSHYIKFSFYENYKSVIFLIIVLNVYSIYKEIMELVGHVTLTLIKTGLNRQT